MKNVSRIAITLGMAVGLAACDENKLDFTRTSATEKSVVFNDLEVVVYNQHEEMRQDPRCGATWVGNNPIYNTCPVMVIEEDRREKISVTVEFPEGSELSGGQKEKWIGEFTNDYDHPENPYGTLTLKVKSAKHDYDKDSLKDIPAYYNQMTVISVQLKN